MAHSRKKSQWHVVSHTRQLEFLRQTLDEKTYYADQTFQHWICQRQYCKCRKNITTYTSKSTLSQFTTLFTPKSFVIRELGFRAHAIVAALLIPYSQSCWRIRVHQIYTQNTSAYAAVLETESCMQTWVLSHLQDFFGNYNMIVIVHSTRMSIVYNYCKSKVPQVQYAGMDKIQISLSKKSISYHQPASPKKLRRDIFSFQTLYLWFCCYAARIAY